MAKQVDMWRREGRPWLLERMRRREWTQADLARALDVPPGTVSRWITLARPPAPEMCLRIADAFAADIDEVLTLAGWRPVLPAEDRLTRETVATMRQLGPEDRRTVYEYAQFRLRLARVNGDVEAVS